MIDQPSLIVRQLGFSLYTPVWHAMKWFNEHRDAASADEFWLVTHPPVFTLGQAGKREHILSHSFIPIVQTDRGGQVTYHGPGQIVLYTLIDIRRLKLGVRQLVTHLETAVIELLGQYGIASAARADAPGVYIDGRKVASLGLRIRRGCSYHGLALNIEMDLSPYALINPCGYAGLQVTQLVDEGVMAEQHILEEQLVAKLADQLGYHCTRIETGLPLLEGLV